jgi:hypothetical protein
MVVSGIYLLRGLVYLSEGAAKNMQVAQFFWEKPVPAEKSPIAWFDTGLPVISSLRRIRLLFKQSPDGSNHFAEIKVLSDAALVWCQPKRFDRATNFL